MVPGSSQDSVGFPQPHFGLNLISRRLHHIAASRLLVPHSSQLRASPLA